jgi:metallo-beta-lactamase family protein
MFGQYVPVKAKIEEISSMSAHADQFEILDWLRSFKKFPKNVFIVHGEPQAADALRVRINDLAKNSLVKIPCRLERIELK